MTPGSLRKQIGKLGAFFLVVAGSLMADPAADVSRCVDQLRAESSYTWTVSNPPIDVSVSRTRTIRGDTAVSTVVSFSPEITGKVGRSGLARLEVHFPSMLTVVLMMNAKGQIIAETPDGWMTLDEVQRETYAGNNDSIFYQDKEYSRRGFFSAVSDAFRSRRPSDELPVILKAITSYRTEGDEVIGELSTTAAAIALGSRAAKSGTKMDEENAPGVKGSVIFRFTHGQLREYEIRAEGGADPTRFSVVHQMSMDRITTINYGASTLFELPEDAAKKLGVK